MFPIQSFEVFTFTLPLFLLLCEALMIFLVDGFELDRLIGILSPAGGTPAIEVFLDMVPAEPTDLVTAGAWLKVEI